MSGAEGVASRSYLVDGCAEFDRLCGELATDWFKVEVARRDYHRSDLDTFDWRLYRRGLRLRVECAAGASTLLLEAQGRLQARTPVERVPRFARELPAGPLRSTVAAVTDIRALLPLNGLRIDESVCELRDAEHKLRARLLCHCAAPVVERGAPLPTLLTAQGVRGFAADLRQLTDILDARPGCRATEAGLLELSLAAGDRPPGGYDGRVRLDFDHCAPLHETLRIAFAQFLDAMQANEPGMREALDTEFLHDFRVALRRTRSLLKLFAHTLPADRAERFAAEFRWLGRITGELRDLDVYLLDLEGFRGDLPAALAAGVEGLRAPLERLRAAAQDRLVANLGSPRYRALLRDWRAFLADRGWPRGGEGLRAAAAVVGARTARLHRRLLRRGQAIGAASPASELHRLRRRCKQLRYLLETYRSLYGAGARDYLSALKRLQELLGRHQDCEVQAEHLLDSAAELRAAAATDHSTLLAVGGLVAILQRRQDRYRRRFTKVFERFRHDTAQADFWSAATADP